MIRLVHSATVSMIATGFLLSMNSISHSDEPKTSFMPVVPSESFDEVFEKDSAAKPEVMQGQKDLLESRYDLSDKPSEVMMSGERKSVQSGIRVKLPEELTWKQLSEMSPSEIREQKSLSGRISTTPTRQTFNRRPSVSFHANRRN
ncbi:hypothetical protein KOR42_27670 [Thalassoglobus neptunius]|uniref:Uncharacterized protein n=1 Tax=Thalassoglobus neptunius TaxID=1938619 RepID=A0A5C5WYH8_9PLAN|nr:hypothetical protein [Thalassoglobus neptunius]TWT55640.1 hypothetical protein KOR42_27670 [Thalassoglobus neptunius]